MVREEKDNRLNGYDNEGYHLDQQAEEEEESGNEDDRLRVVVTENGHRPRDDSPLPNGHAHEETNGHMNVNGTAVIVLDEEENDVKKSNMEEREHRLKTDSMQKPLDTRLHHYVPVDDIDRKVLNGSDGTHITIPEDAVISFTTGRVRVKKSASNSPQSVGDRESIPLATMPPSYTEEKIGLGEKAELEAELANHKNGVWSEGHNYGSAHGPFSNSEKLNGTSKSSDEVSLPVNNHRKCLSREASDSSCSEQKSTGEKLYFTEDNRKLCPGWRRILICGLILIIIAVALLLGVLAATGILLAESENKNTRYESGQSLPSVDSLSLAGHSFRPRPPPKVPEKFLPPVTVDAQIPPNVTPEANDEVNDTVSQTPATVSSKVPAMNDTSHSQTIVPNALIGEFTIINENFTEDLRDNRSQGYMNLAGHLEAELRRIFKKSDAVFESLKILNFSPGSLKVKFLVIWQSDSGFILANQASEILSSDLTEKNNSFGGFFVVDIGSIHFTDVFDECRIQKGGCSFFCIWNYNTLTKTCTCPDGMVLLPDKRSCTQRDLVIPVTSTEKTSTFSSAAITSTLTNKMRKESEPSNLGITAVSSAQDVLTTEEVSTTAKNDNLLVMTNFTDTHTEKPLEYSTTEISTTSLATSVETTYVKTFTTLEPLKTTTVNRETTHEGALNKFIPLTTQATTFPSVKDTGISEELMTPMFLTTENTETPKEVTTSGTTVTTNTEILDQLGKEEENNKQDEFSTTVVEDSPKLVAEQTTAVTFPESTTSKKITEVTTEEVATSAMERVTSSAFDDEFATMSIGFHITGPTTEIYTLKENTDYITNYSSRGHQTSSTTVNNQDSEQTSTLPTNKYTINGNEDNFYVTTVLSSDSTVTSAVSEDSDGTENFEKDHSTLNPLKDINYSGTSTEETVKPLSLYFTTPIPDIINTEKSGTTMFDVSEKFATTVSDVEEYSTLSSFLEENITTVVSGAEESFTTVFSEPINNFTTVKSDAEENIFTTVPSFFSTAGSSDADENITTMKSSTFVSSHSNKTPEVRSFDNFTSFIENFTLTSDAGYINRDFTSFNSSIELSTLSDNPSINSSTFLPSTEPPVTESSESGTAFPKHILSNIDTAINATPEATSTNAFEEPNSSDATVNFFTTENISTIAPQNTHTAITENKEVVYNAITVKSDDNMATNTPDSSILDVTSTLTDVTKIDGEINATSEFISENFTEVESNFPVTESSFPDSTTIQNRSNGSTNSTKDLEVNTKYLLTTNVFPETSTTPTSFTESGDETQSEMPEMSVFSENNVTTLDIPVTEATKTELSGEAVTLDVTSEVTTVISSENANSDNSQYSVTTMMTDRVISTTKIDSNSTIFEPQTKATTAFIEVTSKLDDSVLSTGNYDEYSTTSYMVTTNNPPNDTELIQDMNVTIETETSEQVNISTVSFNESYITELPKNSEEILTLNYTSLENDTIVTTEKSYFDSNSTDIKNTTDDDYLDALTVTPINLVFAEENSTFLDDSNFTAGTYEDALNGTTTDAAVGLVCREDQFLCGPLNVCINNTFLCDGIEDCPDGQDEFKCQDSCQSNFRCVNSSMCIMSEARCDGIWDCEDGTDEDDCTPTECAKHEVMCLDGSKCIKPGHICDWKYNCKDRSDEVGCVERTTCESGGKFFCNDGLCIPWSLKCDGEYDCKDGEDEGNCTCLSNEFQCNDGTCLQSSLRCDGRQDCRDADDEMGCVNVDTQNVVITFEPYHNKWAMLCGEDWTLDDGHYLCQELGFGHALKAEKVHVSFNGTWMGMRRENLTESSMWTERVSSIEICASSLAATVECQKFSCGEYPGLLHRRKREVLGSSSTQWPFIGYTSTFQSNKGCLSEILTPIWLITSAECLNSIRREPYNGSDWYVRTNIGKNVDADSAAEKHEVLRIISHPHSSKFRSLTIRDYDVALIRLKHALVFVGDKIGAICLPEEQVPPGITCFSGVLGTQRPRALPPPELTINSLALQIIDRNLCNGIDHYNNQINQRGLCTQSSEGHTICDNDEGTPLMCLTGINKWFLAGTLTYQRFCDVYSKHPAVFSNLFSMRKFVDQVIGQKQYETPYNSSMYVIIPPTTPSPIVPETTTPLLSTTEMLETTTLETTSTTLEMTGTTPETTTISDSTTVITEKLSENLQDAMTEFTEEFRSEENITAAFEITANYSTSADDVIYDTTTAINTDLLEFGVENSTTRPMFPEDEVLSNDSVTDKTHDSLMMSFLNETYADSEANATEISIFENGTSLYDNDTSSVLEEITSTPNPLTTQDGLSVFITESSNLTSVDSNETTSSDTLSISDTDEAKTNTMITETFTLPKESTILTTSMVTATVNENLKIESTTSSYKEEFVNPDLKATTLEMKTEPKHREKFEFELTGEPDTDMTFALFSDVDGIKLETEKASKNLKLSNISKEYVPRSRNLEEQPFINASDIFYEPIPTVGVPFDSNTTIFSSDGSFKEQPFINVSDIFEPIAATNISYNSDATLLPESRNHEKLHFTETTFINVSDIFEPTAATNISYNSDATLLPESRNHEKLHLTETTHLTESYNLTEQPNTDAYDTLHESVTTTEISHNSETTHLISSSYTEEKTHTSNMDIMHDSTFTTDDLPYSEITYSTTSQNLEQPDSSTSYVFYEPLSTTDIPYDSEAIHLSKNESFELPHETISDISDMPLFTTKIPRALETTQIMTTVQNTSLNMSGQATMDVTTTSLITTSIKMDTTTAVFDTTQDVNTTEPYSEDPTFITTAIPVVTSDITKDVETASGSNTQIFKDHLISEKLQILEKKNFTAYDTEECGMWDQDSNVTVTSEQFFMNWPALGFLQMVSHPKMCASSILSPHFVITSLSCLSFRDNQLNPDKWAYIGGLYDESSSISGTQSHLVSKIIPYPKRNPPLLFNENDLALVQVKDEIKLDRYSKNACLPYDKPQTGQECFISGWKKSSSDDDQGKEFLSIPVSIISNEECNNTANYNGMLLESLICSMNNNESFQACQMDIGSPLFCLGENERWEIQGILNFPSPCDMTQPAVFNSIYSIQEWAIEIVRNETTNTSFSED